MSEVQSQKSEEISAFLRERIEAEDFPSAVYLVGERGEIVFADALGFAVKTKEIQIPAQFDTIYDVASLTKPLVTGLLTAKLIESGALDLNAKISSVFSEFDGNNKREITIRDLLAHISGFPAWQPFYLKAEATNPHVSILKLIAAAPLENKRGMKVTYSDFNFILLGFLHEKLCHKNLDEIADAEIFSKLKLNRTFFNPPESQKNEIAACEFGNEYEKQICQEMGFEIRTPHSAFRNRLIWGEAHDGNCYFMNGVSGHAGLFSTAEEVFKIAQQFLPQQTQILKPETCELFKTDLTPNLNEARSLAFQLAATEDSTASLSLAKNSFGHLGFTGTSLWIEPETERVFVLLTNRTHRPLPFVNINRTRRRFHEIAAKLLAEK